MKFIKDYLKERNIPLDSLEANYIKEGFIQGYYYTLDETMNKLLNDEQSTNNFKDIRYFIDTETPEDYLDKFYTIQIMQRSKEHSEFDKHKNVILSNFYIKSSDELEQLMPTIKDICNATNARAYFNPNIRSKKELAKQLLTKTTEIITGSMSNDDPQYFNKITGIVSHCINTQKSKNKFWLIDVDDIKCKSDIEQFLIANKIKYYIFLTPNGCHFITKPFKLDEFEKHYIFGLKDITLHTDNPTILYAPKYINIKQQNKEEEKS